MHTPVYLSSFIFFFYPRFPIRITKVGAQRCRLHYPRVRALVGALLLFSKGPGITSGRNCLRRADAPQWSPR